MSQYIEPVKSALVLFPFVALVLTLPYMLFQYRRYGAVLLLRTAIVYSFVLYLMCAYFLVILPLPDVENGQRADLRARAADSLPGGGGPAAQRRRGPRAGLPRGYRLVWNRDFFQIVANVAMFTPLGIYLRYYFGCSLKKTLLFSLLLSLFFELTQLTGLYGYYPRPYRLADVDDLITNTCGGLLGYALAPLAMRLLPSREQMDARAYRKGEQVRRDPPLLCGAGGLCGDAGGSRGADVAAALGDAVRRRSRGDGGVAVWLLCRWNCGVLCAWHMAGWRTHGGQGAFAPAPDGPAKRRPSQTVAVRGALWGFVPGGDAHSPRFCCWPSPWGTEDGEIGVWLVLACIGLLMVYILFWLLLAVHVVTHDNQLLHGKLSMTHNVSTLRHRYFARWHGAPACA